MDIENAREPPSTPGGKGRKQGKANGGANSAPRLAIPSIHEIKKDQWNNFDPPFTAFDALRVCRDGEGGYDFYLNIDNTFLLTELSRSGDNDKPLIKYWFKYGLALCALGMLQHSQSAEEKSTNSHAQKDGEALKMAEGAIGDPVDFVNRATAGLSRVVIPVVRSLYRGPD